mmetsp:Transcript_7827/g.16666  ORF Transcript_7827/g.16666 Transcript_7827/m.16666 type:complete len:91 (-) Transcript_7827:700-972(-)
MRHPNPEFQGHETLRDGEFGASALAREQRNAGSYCQGRSAQNTATAADSLALQGTFADATISRSSQRERAEMAIDLASAGSRIPAELLAE